jgi:hypothetical protein
VSFAVRALVLAGGISDDAVDQLGPALNARAVGTVKSAINLLPKSQRGATLGAEALAQAPREAQTELIAFLERTGEPGPGRRIAPVRSFRRRAAAARAGRAQSPQAARKTPVRSRSPECRHAPMSQGW